MADPASIKVMCIFEACSRLRCDSEKACLAAFIYHRFFRYKEKERYDVYVMAAAAIKLAHRFFEIPIDTKNLILTVISIIHGPTFYLSDQILAKVRRTITIAEKIISTNLEYYLNFKDDRMMTPGQLQEHYRNKQSEEESQRSKQVINISDSEESSSYEDDDDRPMLKADSMLAKNSRYAISSHRYLVHYLKCIQYLLPADCPMTMDIFNKISNLSWIILCDFHWSSNVTQIYANHLACVCLMMAIETFRVDLEKNRSESKRALWQQLDRKWNLIFCDDFANTHRGRAIDLIVFNYNDYERLQQLELSLSVIDPTSR